MRLNETKIACPRCRSQQKFSLQRKYTSKDSEKFTVVVRCKNCRKEISLYDTTGEIEALKRVIRKVQREVKIAPSQSRLNLLTKLKERMYNLERSLSEDLGDKVVTGVAIKPEPVHVVPVDDWYEHNSESIECDCHPKIVVLDNGGTQVIHNAYDGREHLDADHDWRNCEICMADLETTDKGW